MYTHGELIGTRENDDVIRIWANENLVDLVIKKEEEEKDEESMIDWNKRHYLAYSIVQYKQDIVDEMKIKEKDIPWGIIEHH